MNDQARSLLDRYFYATRRLLPRAQRDDIVSELREIVQSQVDDEEEKLQRPLEEHEVGEILKRFGQPRDVASRYGSRQYLIGPEIFPSYVVAIKVVLWVMTLLTVFMVAVTVVTTEEYLLGPLLNTLWTVLSIGLVNLSIVTFLFFYFGRAASGNLNADEWDLDDLPEMPANPNAPLHRSEMIGSMTGLALMLCWFLGLNAVLQRIFGWEPVPVVWAPIWRDVTLAAVSILVAGIARDLMGLIRPRWIRPYLISGVVLDLLALLVLFRLITADSYLGVAGESPMKALVFLVNGAIFLGLTLMSLLVAISCIQSVSRLLRTSRMTFGTNP